MVSEMECVSSCGFQGRKQAQNVGSSREKLVSGYQAYHSFVDQKTLSNRKENAKVAGEWLGSFWTAYGRELHSGQLSPALISTQTHQDVHSMWAYIQYQKEVWNF